MKKLAPAAGDDDERGDESDDATDESDDDETGDAKYDDDVPL